MSALGDFLEILYGPADQRFGTLHATLRHWYDHNLAERAMGSQPSQIGRRKSGTTGEPRISQTTLDVWFSSPGRTRIEEHHEVDGQIETELSVVSGERWWKRDREGHVESAETGSRGPCLIDAERHFDPAMIRQFFLQLVMEGRGSVQMAGRDCVRLHATLRPKGSLWPHWLPKDADAYEFHADRERGVLLAIYSKFEGQVFASHEVLSIAFDEPLDVELFAYTPQVGEQLRAVIPVSEDLSLAAAIARMPFTVLLPRRLPDAEHWQMQVHYHPSRCGSAPAMLTVTFLNYDLDAHVWLSEGAYQDPGAGEYDWEQIQVGGRELHISDPGPGKGMRMVAVEERGTHVEICSDLDRDCVLEMALSLVPAAEAHLG